MEMLFSVVSFPFEFEDLSIKRALGDMKYTKGAAFRTGLEGGRSLG
jgi:hypothetical protein